MTDAQKLKNKFSKLIWKNHNYIENDFHYKLSDGTLIIIWGDIFISHYISIMSHSYISYLDAVKLIKFSNFQ